MSSDQPPVDPRHDLSGSIRENSLSNRIPLDSVVHDDRRSCFSASVEMTGGRKRRTILPLVLFVVTAFSVFWAGALQWMPHVYLTYMANWLSPFTDVLNDPAMLIRRSLLRHWSDGLIYMGCLLGILLTHEMGHFLMTVRYRIAASWPYFLPLPISPIGTLGAVIGMDGMRANRKEIFDIGLAGPLAGLVVCIPVLWIGIQQLDFTQPAGGPYALDLPLVIRWTLAIRAPEGYTGDGQLSHSQLNPYFMAGWVGLLVTGLNMLPVSQLDGGHVVYALFGRRAHWIARTFLVLAIAYIVYTGTYSWSLMILLILMMGTDHPPTSNDQVRLGPVRIALGWLSLLIPLLCFPPRVLQEL
jgi:Zn-dependent protease